MDMKEFFIQSGYYLNNNQGFHVLINAIKLTRDLKTLALASPEWSFFVHLLRSSITKKNLLFVDDVIDFCMDFGTPTIEDLTEWVIKSKSDMIMDILEPKIEINTDTKISRPELKKIITEKCHIEDNCIWNYGDAEYILPSLEEVKEILAKSPINTYSYIPNGHDCEDFSRELKTWLSKRGIGNLALSFIEVNQYNVDGKLVSAHGINLVVTKEHDVYFIEPQTDEIFDPKADPLGFNGITLQKIRFLVF
jgi:hypothetical protein